MQKTCPQCYLTPLATEWDTCPRCGQTLTRDSSAPVWRKRAAIGVSLAAVVAAGAFGGAALLNGDDDAPSVAETAPVATSAPPSAAPPVQLSQASLSNSDIAQKYGDSVYRLEAEGCGFVSSGTGWVIDEHHLVTNWHVVSTDITPTVIARDGSTLDGEVIGGTTRPDVAVVRVEGQLADPLPWALTDELTEGQEIVGLGYPAPALDFSVTPGSIVSFQVTDGQREAIRTDSALDKGNSGGPALTRSGQVAGVVTEMAANDGLQLVPLLYTPANLEPVVTDMIEDPQQVEPDCDPDFDVMPDDDWFDDLPDRASEYGDDPVLDQLYDQCESGDMGACDSLYWGSGFGTAYEAMATSCGGLAGSPLYGLCEYYSAQAEADAQRAVESDAAQEETDAMATHLTGRCKDGDMAACDDLKLIAGWAPGLADVAYDCGGHYPGNSGSCAARETHETMINDLATDCSDGDMWACEELQYKAEYGSEAAQLGKDCGGHYPEARGFCQSAEQETKDLQGLYEACKKGDMAACDDLHWSANYNTDFADFGGTCGNRYPSVVPGMCEYEYGR